MSLPILGDDNSSTKSQSVNATIRPERDRFFFGGPVGMVISLQNVSGLDLLIDFSYPELLGLKLHARGTEPDSVIERPAEFRPSAYQTLTKMQAGTSTDLTVYLNRYFLFRMAGNYEIKCLLRVNSFEMDKAGNPILSSKRTDSFKSQFTVALAKGDDVELERELQALALHLLSDEKRKRMEAIEAVAFLDSVVSVKYLAKALTIPEGRIPAIRALARVDTPESQQLLKSAVFDSDSGAVQVALEALASRNILLDLKQIEHLLRSPSPNTKYFTIVYLSKIGRPLHGPLLAPLLNDPDPVIQEAAKKCMDQLEKEH